VTDNPEGRVSEQDARRPARALLIVVSAPSGAGKTSLCERLLSTHSDMAYSISCTTRPPRGREQDGREYHFLSEAEFERRLQAGEFLEHAVVHGHRYGTLRRTVAEVLEAGRSVLMDIDVQGAAQIRDRARNAPAGDPIRRGFVDVFISPPSMSALRERLEGRGEDDPQTIDRRLRNAEAEMGRCGEYRYTVVNDDLGRAAAALEEIIARERNSP
jgi:guanylate kinase